MMCDILKNCEALSLVHSGGNDAGGLIEKPPCDTQIIPHPTHCRRKAEISEMYHSPPLTGPTSRLHHSLLLH